MLAPGIIAAIVSVVVVVVVAAFLIGYCVWKNWDDDEDEGQDKANNNDTIPGSVAVASSLSAAAAHNNMMSPSNAYLRHLTPSAAASVNQSVVGGFGATPINSGATSLRASTVNPMPSTGRSAATTAAGSRANAYAAKSQHVPLSRRLADGAHLYYCFPDGDDQNQQQNQQQQSKTVHEIDLVQVGLGTETTKYVAFALISELAAKHLPPTFEWVEGKLPPKMCLAGAPEETDDDEDEDNEADGHDESLDGTQRPGHHVTIKKTKQSNNAKPKKPPLVVLDLEQLVGDAESVAETATWPLSLFIVDHHVKPGLAPARVSMQQHNQQLLLNKQQRPSPRPLTASNFNNNSDGQQRSQEEHNTNNQFTSIGDIPPIIMANNSSADFRYRSSVNFIPHNNNNNNNNNNSSTSRGISQDSSSFGVNYSTRDTFFAHGFENNSLLVPLMAPRIYPYTPTVTTRTPIRIAATQFRCRRTGAFVQDRWKVYALDETMAKLPPSFLKLVLRRRREQEQEQEQQQQTILEQELEEILPMTVEFSSRKSSATTNNVPLPHLTVTAARDGTMFLKSVPKKAKKKDRKRKQQQDVGGAAVVAAVDTSSAAASDTSDSDMSSYNQQTTQLLHFDVIPMGLLYKVEGGVNSHPATDAPWHYVDAEGNCDNFPHQQQNNSSSNRNSSKAVATASRHDKSRSAGAGVVYLPLGRVCVVAKTRRPDDGEFNHQYRGAGPEPSWSTVYTVSAATTRDDVTDYSHAALHFAGI